MLATASRPVAFIPLSLPLLNDYTETHRDGSNAFIYSRFLVPHLQDYKGWSIFADGDMILRDDIAQLWKMRDERYAVMVAKHIYKTKAKRKYLGSSMETINPDYDRKNWSSLILWNCEHPFNRLLTPEYVMDGTGRNLHRFAHLSDDDIGTLPLEWNWLVGEYGPNEDAKLVHFTLGIPAIAAYEKCDYSREWFEHFYKVSGCE